MKFKTKLLSVLGATAIASSSLGLIASCSFNPAPKPDDPYVAVRRITYDGPWTIMTDEDKPNCVIMNFQIDRNFITGEKVLVTASEVDGTHCITKCYASDIGTQTGHRNSFNVAIEFDKDVEPILSTKQVQLELSFQIMAEGVETYDVPFYNPEDEVFTIKYVEKLPTNKVLMTQGFSAYDIDFTEGGTKRGEDSNSFVLPGESFYLEEGLHEDESVEVSTDLYYLQAFILDMSIDGKFTIGFKVVNYGDFRKLTIDDITLRFTVLRNGLPEGEDQTFEGFRAEYMPDWQPNNITFVGKSTSWKNEKLTVEDYVSTLPTIQTIQSFRLLRKLEKDTVHDITEDLDIVVLKEDATTISDISDKIAIPENGWEIVGVGDRYLNIKFEYIGYEADENKFTDKPINFKLGFIFTENDKTMHSQIVTCDSVTGCFTFDYVAPWEPIDVQWRGESGSEIYEPAQGVETWEMSDLTNTSAHKWFELDRSLKTNEYLVPELVDAPGHTGDASKLTIGSYDVDKRTVEGTSIACLNVRVIDPEVEGTFYFKVKFKVYEGDIDPSCLKMEKVVDTEFQFHFRRSVFEGQVFVSDVVTGAGEISKTFTTSIPGDMPTGTVSLEWNPPAKGALDIRILKVENKIVTLEATVAPEDSTKTEVWEGIKFSLVFKDGETEIAHYDSNNFKVTYTEEEIVDPFDPEVVTWEEYIDGRSFAMEIKSSNTLSTQTCWLLADATPTIDDDYQYYFSTTWNFKRQYEKLASKSDFKVSITTKTLQNSHKVSETSSGSKTNLSCSVDGIDSEFLPVPNPATDIVWHNKEADFALYSGGPTTEGYNYKGGPDIYVGKINLGDVVKKDSPLEAHLKKLNAIRKKEGHINNFSTKAVPYDGQGYTRFFFSGFKETQYYVDSLPGQKTTLNWNEEGYNGYNQRDMRDPGGSSWDSITNWTFYPFHSTNPNDTYDIFADYCTNEGTLFGDDDDYDHACYTYLPVVWSGSTHKDGYSYKNGDTFFGYRLYDHWYVWNGPSASGNHPYFSKLFTPGSMMIAYDTTEAEPKWVVVGQYVGLTHYDTMLSSFGWIPLLDAFCDANGNRNVYKQFIETY